MHFFFIASLDKAKQTYCTHSASGLFLLACKPTACVRFVSASHSELAQDTSEVKVIFLLTIEVLGKINSRQCNSLGDEVLDVNSFCT